MSSCNADAWQTESMLAYFEDHRNSTEDVYPSEWFFIKDLLKEGLSILDIGCAQGGFFDVFSDHISSFEYTGIDISEKMIALAKEKHPRGVFHQVSEGDYSILENKSFDLVLCLGILHLHESWRETLRAAWLATKGCLVFDLREYAGRTIEDKMVANFSTDVPGASDTSIEVSLPYNIMNTSDALDIVSDVCQGSSAIERYGYLHPVSHLARCPINETMVTAYCVNKEKSV